MIIPSGFQIGLMLERDKLKKRRDVLFKNFADDPKIKDHEEYEQCEAVIKWLTKRISELRRT